ncbi:hypothetical protein [Halobiforma nitratireducens]|uniref:Uncharacterized protein n=1 Tax=Halobiforma nitratireducens JCM 10879 TaxID=1227454 RepID=M0M4H7_9EURY|nr:hypothetical protein [Halobiforma nitratireducens]EMA39504.1 hypothetical protein C446_08656 [Halobiforma nitratireducens JCM 10879]
MAESPLEWFREDGEWTTPDGRPAELLVLVVGIPVFAWLVSLRSGIALPWSAPTSGVTGTAAQFRPWGAAGLGLFAGFLYAVYYRDVIVSRLPEFSSWTLLSLFGGGFGLSTLEVLPATSSVTAFLLTAGTTVLVIYLLWLASPLHDGLTPSRRGVEPPAAVGPE